MGHETTYVTKTCGRKF